VPNKGYDAAKLTVRNGEVFFLRMVIVAILCPVGLQTLFAAAIRFSSSGAE
jgi:hypothetical protein